MCVEIQPRIQILDHHGKQRLVILAVGRDLHRHAQVDPDTVGQAVAVVIDVPKDGIGIRPRKAVQMERPIVRAVKFRVIFCERPEHKPALLIGVCVPLHAVPVDQGRVVERGRLHLPAILVGVPHAGRQVDVVVIRDVVIFVGTARGEVVGTDIGPAFGIGIQGNRLDVARRRIKAKTGTVERPAVDDKLIVYRGTDQRRRGVARQRDAQQTEAEVGAAVTLVVDDAERTVAQVPRGECQHLAGVVVGNFLERGEVRNGRIHIDRHAQIPPRAVPIDAVNNPSGGCMSVEVFQQAVNPGSRVRVLRAADQLPECAFQQLIETVVESFGGGGRTRAHLELARGNHIGHSHRRQQGQKAHHHQQDNAAPAANRSRSVAMYVCSSLHGICTLRSEVSLPWPASLMVKVI